MSQFVKIDQCNPLGRANSYGILAPRMGLITLNQYITDAAGNRIMFKLLYVGVGGTINIEQIDGVATGSIGPFAAGTYVPAIGYRVLTTGTSASSITYFAGQGGGANGL
jgi:hypothetical protein